MHKYDSCKYCRYGDTCFQIERCELCERISLSPWPTNWVPMTDAQKVERAFYNTGIPKIKGTLKSGYMYNLPRKEYNKMYKSKTPRQKALGMIKNVLFNPPYTIVIWDDKTKTIVKCKENEQYDPEKGLAMAMSKRLFANHGFYYDVFKKWLPKEKPALPGSKSIIGIDLSSEARLHTYSVKDLAEQLGCSEDSIRRDIKKGKFPGAKKEKGKWVIHV